MSTSDAWGILMEPTNDPNREVQKYTPPNPQEPPHVCLACMLLNYLEEDPSPTTPNATGFFNGPVFLPKALHSKCFPINAARCVAASLDAGTEIATVQVMIEVSKRPHPHIQGKMEYFIDAFALGSDQEGDWVEYPQPSSPNPDIELSIPIQCPGIDGDRGDADERHADDLTWGGVLKLLRRTSKRKFDEYGTIRSDSEAARKEGEISRNF